MNNISNYQGNGPTLYNNWLAQLQGAELHSTVEYPLFTDARIVGEPSDQFGPYKIINAVRIGGHHDRRPAIVLRVDYYLDEPVHNFNETNDSTYHGGWLSDEIASLISLCLGVRIKSGGETRIFGMDKDPRGRPISWGFNDDPILHSIKDKVIIPQAIKEHSLDLFSRFSNLPLLLPEGAVALIRAARLYQEALWIAETTPELSWIMFTSAIETAANYWRTTIEKPLDRLKASHTKLFELLTEQGGEVFTKQVADLLVPYLGATKKFTDFVIKHLPAPPETRPSKDFQVSWSKTAMKEHLSKIYEHRSKALHGGTPFPAPMCMAPREPLKDQIEEVPLGLAMSAMGGVWVRKDTPMLLHVFEYVVRKTLLNWWDKLLVKDEAEQT